jgi:hypothetical protein
MTHGYKIKARASLAFPGASAIAASFAVAIISMGRTQAEPGLRFTVATRGLTATR